MKMSHDSDTYKVQSLECDGSSIEIVFKIETTTQNFKTLHTQSIIIKKKDPKKGTRASTICSSFGELTVTPNDSDVTWRIDGHFS